MTKETLQHLCDQGLSQAQIGIWLNIKQPTVSYWMKKYAIVSSNEWFVKNKKIKHCPYCKQDKPIEEFYKRRGKEGAAPYCKECSRLEIIARQSLFKQKCVEYKGGKCITCGYDKCLAALEFHHKNPEEKDFAITRKASCTFESVKKELDKCDLLCCRCHREQHNLSK